MYIFTQNMVNLLFVCLFVCFTRPRREVSCFSRLITSVGGTHLPIGVKSALELSGTPWIPSTWALPRDVAHTSSRLSPAGYGQETSPMSVDQRLTQCPRRDGSLLEESQLSPGTLSACVTVQTPATPLPMGTSEFHSPSREGAVWHIWGHQLCSAAPSIRWASGSGFGGRQGLHFPSREGAVWHIRGHWLCSASEKNQEKCNCHEAHC